MELTEVTGSDSIEQMVASAAYTPSSLGAVCLQVMSTAETGLFRFCLTRPAPSFRVGSDR
jgi:hypothetical protein